MDSFPPTQQKNLSRLLLRRTSLPNPLGHFAASRRTSTAPHLQAAGESPTYAERGEANGPPQRLTSRPSGRSSAPRSRASRPPEKEAKPPVTVGRRRRSHRWGEGSVTARCGVALQDSRPSARSRTAAPSPVAAFGSERRPPPPRCKRGWGPATAAALAPAEKTEHAGTGGSEEKDEAGRVQRQARGSGRSALLLSHK